MTTPVAFDRFAPIMERETIHEIREAVRNGRIQHEFTPADVNNALGIDWAGTFLPKHRVGNPGRHTELFVRVRSGVYELRAEKRS